MKSGQKFGEQLLYDNRICNQFVTDMQKAGLSLQHYEGRFGWEGPAVVVPASRLIDIMEATRTKLQTDHLAKDFVVYPIAAGKRIDPNQPGPSKNKGAAATIDIEKRGVKNVRRR